MAEMIPGAFAPTSRDLDCVFSMECIWVNQHVSGAGLLSTYPHDIVNRNVLSNSNNEWNFRFNGFFNGCRGLGRCNVDTSRVWLQLLHSLPYGANNRKAQVLLSIFLRIGSADNVCTPCNRLLRVGGSKFACKALEDDAGMGPDLEVLNCIIVATAS